LLVSKESKPRGLGSGYPLRGFSLLIEYVTHFGIYNRMFF
jgi:hypothetical protein